MNEEQFKREVRYDVIKLTTGKLVDCVVVEHDWPEYEIVWGMIQDRMEGRLNALEAADKRIAELESQLAECQKDAERQKEWYREQLRRFDCPYIATVEMKKKNYYERLQIISAEPSSMGLKVVVADNAAIKESK